MHRLYYRYGLRALVVAGLLMAVVRADGASEYESFPPTKKLTEFRFWAPALVSARTVTMRVDIPKRALAWLDLPRTETPGLHLSVELRQRGGKLQVTAPLPVTLRSPELPLEFVTEHFDNDRLWKKSVTVELADWPDGEVEVRLRIRAEAGVTEKFAEPAAQTFRIIREPVARLDAAQRAELQTWLDDRNASRLIWGKLPLWPNLSRALQQPADPYRDLRGFLLRSYFNEPLQRRQPYTLYLPQALDLSHPAPLLILLHGSGGDYRNLVADFAAGQDLEKHPMLIANAGAFYYQEYQHLAFNDVLGVLADVQKKYRVDPDRIYCQGISLGGRGVMEMAALRPGLFAAICAQAPYGATQEPDDLPFFLNQTEWGRWSVARWDLRTYLPNLATTPTQFVYGHRDTIAPPLNALAFAHLLKKRYAGQVEALGFDTDHNITVPAYHWSNTREWFLKHRRELNPTNFTARTASLRFNQFYWATVDQFQTQWQLAELAVQTTNDLATIETRNITQLRLQPPPPLRVITLDQQRFDLGSNNTAAATFLRGTNGLWQVAAPGAPPAHRGKRHGLSGPIWDANHGRCLAVYGTGGSAPETELLRQMAGAVARLDATWGEPSWPVVADSAVAEQDRQNCNLLLVGDARTNRLLRDQTWPFDLERIGRGQGIQVFDKTYGQSGDVLHFIYPSPFSSNAYVYVVAPVHGPGPVVSPKTSFETATWSDWFVRRASPDNPESVQHLADGVFDNNWQLQPMPGKSLAVTPMNWE